jgi:Xaa-Pro dipeptidase
MDNSPIFPTDELDRRLAAVRTAMAARGLKGLAVSVPENIYYLTGLDHWGFFAAHVLVVPSEGRPVLVARAIERITAENQVRNADFRGHADHEEVSDHVVATLRDLGLGKARLGMEMRSLFLTPRHADRIRAATPAAEWHDCSGLIDEIRLVKSALELSYVRKAAEAAEAGTAAAIAAIGDGVTDYEVAAECHRAMILAGSEYPGFGPFIRPGRRLGEEHTTWRGDVFRNGDTVFLEIGAAYRKYQAPMGRVVHIGRAPKVAEAAAELAIAGMRAIVAALKPGTTGGAVYDAWQRVADQAGLTGYRRHHCGYLIGIGFPPSWTGGSMVTSLAPDSARVLQPGMVFHLHSWFSNTGRGDAFTYFISNTAILSENGAEVLTDRTPETLCVRGGQAAENRRVAK